MPHQRPVVISGLVEQAGFVCLGFAKVSWFRLSTEWKRHLTSVSETTIVLWNVSGAFQFKTISCTEGKNLVWCRRCLVAVALSRLYLPISPVGVQCWKYRSPTWKVDTLDHKRHWYESLIITAFNFRQSMYEWSVPSFFWKKQSGIPIPSGLVPYRPWRAFSKSLDFQILSRSALLKNRLNEQISYSSCGARFGAAPLLWNQGGRLPCSQLCRQMI